MGLYNEYVRKQNEAVISEFEASSLLKKGHLIHTVTGLGSENKGGG